MQKILMSGGHKTVMNSGKGCLRIQTLENMGKSLDSTVKYHINYSIINYSIKTICMMVI